MGGKIARPRKCSRRRSAALAALAALVLLGGCGGGSHAHARTKAATHPASPKTTTQPKKSQKAPPANPALHPADPKRVAVVRAWADALRAGRLARASSYFSVPVLIQNGGPLLRLGSRSAVRLFNSSLPCGAVVVRAIATPRYTVVTFKLTKRVNAPSPCGTGVGDLAATAFAFRRGKISEWRRVAVPSTGTQQGTEAA